MKNEAEDFMENARKSFRLAGAAQGMDQMESYVKMGREYMLLARSAAEVVVSNHSPTLWPTQSI